MNLGRGNNIYDHSINNNSMEQITNKNSLEQRFEIFRQNESNFQLNNSQDSDNFIDFTLGNYLIKNKNPNLNEELKKINQLILIGVSGCGKTQSIYELSHHQFVLYLIGCGIGDKALDKSFTRCMFYIQEFIHNKGYISQLKDPQVCEGLKEHLKRWKLKIEKGIFTINEICMDYLVRKYTNKMILGLISVKLLYLYHFLKLTNGNLKPNEFFQWQLNAGNQKCEDLFEELCKYDFDSESFIRHIMFENNNQTFNKEKPIIIALEEANTLVKTNENSTILSKETNEKRGIIKPIVYILFYLCEKYKNTFKLIISGTALSLNDRKILESASYKIEKELSQNEKYKICCDFNPFFPKDVGNFLKHYLNLKNADQKLIKQICNKFSGRTRISCRFLEFLLKQMILLNQITKKKTKKRKEESDFNKNQILINKLKETDAFAKKDFNDKMKKIKIYSNLKPVENILKEIVYQFLIKRNSEIKIDVANKNIVKILDQGFFYLKLQPNSNYFYKAYDYYQLKFLSNHYSIPALCKDYILDLWEPNSIHKLSNGKVFEYLIALQLLKFNGLKISELPFLKNLKNKNNEKINLPDWMEKKKFNIKHIFSNFEIQKTNDDDNVGEKKKKTKKKRRKKKNVITMNDFKIIKKLNEELETYESEQFSNQNNKEQTYYLPKYDFSIHINHLETRNKFQNSSFFNTKKIPRLCFNFPYSSKKGHRNGFEILNKGEEIIFNFDLFNFKNFFIKTDNNKTKYYYIIGLYKEIIYKKYFEQTNKNANEIKGKEPITKYEKILNDKIIEYENNLPGKKLRQNYKNYYKNNVNNSASSQDNGLKIFIDNHLEISKFRIGRIRIIKINTLIKKLEQDKKDSIDIFYLIKWLYTDKLPEFGGFSKKFEDNLLKKFGYNINTRDIFKDHKSMFQNEKSKDLKLILNIKEKEKEIKIHKIILKCRSNYFYQIFNEEKEIEKKKQNLEEYKIKIPNIGYTVLKNVIYFLYMDEFQKNFSKNDQKIKEQLIQISNKWEINFNL
ncbi:btb/poz domain-containing [Anaeramoeba flamelloides]|uniref:Btb/poz domain-containing n=1 Tax=Anaeramoeba flamelloides TaxID=1746091 RepID=A0AAV8AA23_9EUKA|nr:btb/poz domain-containing [Anaeramoeba flamelloides]